MMEKRNKIPEFAILGHPNEGKSSVVSTLAEDDSVRVSPYPGETVKCRSFPVTIDGREIIRFTDTPGFQMPGKTLAWFKEYDGVENGIISAFIEANHNNDLFRDECELLSPLAAGAGIIYVADGSRPLRKADLAEMEILRMTGLPRMAIINSKSDAPDHSARWANEFRKNFNSVRVFNAHQATYRERIDLLDSLKNIDQFWQPALEKVIAAFRQEWSARNMGTAEQICQMLESCLNHKKTVNCTTLKEKEAARKKLQTAYNNDIEKIERNSHQQIRKRFKHNIFNIELPPHSILLKDLFDSETWHLLGLSPGQLTAAAATCGGAAGAILDVATAAHSLGLFTLIGGSVAAASALLGSGKAARTKIAGINLGGYRLQTGPCKNIQLMYILLDRALIFYSHIINWAHGNRSRTSPEEVMSCRKAPGSGFTSGWDKETQAVFNAFFASLRQKDPEKKEACRKKAVQTLKECLDTISGS